MTTHSKGGSLVMGACIVGVVFAVLCQGAVADKLNNFLEAGPGAQAKVARYMSKMNSMNADYGQQDDQVGCNLNVGNLDMSNNHGAVPREQVTVVRGDVINVCK